MVTAREIYRAAVDSIEAIDPLLPSSKRIWAATAGLVVVVGLAGVDRITGPDVGFLVAYACVAAAAGLLLSSRTALVTGSAAALATLLADLGTGGATGLPARAADAALVVLVVAFATFTRRMALDLTAKEKALRFTEMRLVRHGMADPLTGLLNERATSRALHAAIAAARRRGENVWVARFDLRRLREINARSGWPAGDALIRGVAGALAKVARGEDLVARVAPDELAVVFCGPDPIEARRLCARFSAVATAAAREHGASVSHGLAGGDAHGWTADDLLVVSWRASERGKAAPGAGEIFLNVNPAS